MAITDSLEDGVTVLESSWENLFETKGYKALKNDEYIKSIINLAFNPDKQSRLDTLLQTAGYWLKRDLNHLVSVRENKSKLKQYKESLDIDDYIVKGRQKALKYLPKNLDTIYTTPPLQFVVFSPDARVMGGNIIFDLKFMMDMKPEELSNLIGHEFHHYYLGFIEDRIEGPNRESDLYQLYRPIKQLQIEGVADLIDKRTTVKDSTNFKWVDAYYASNEKLKFMNDKLEELSVSDDSIASYGSQIFKNFPINCHPNGFYMAELIEKEYGKEKVIETLTNPFDFLYTYNSVARYNENYFSFSNTAIDYLENLEKQIINSKD